MKSILISAALLLLPYSVDAQWLTYRTPGIPRTADGKPNMTAAAPRAADGHPDLSGLWVMPLNTAIGNIAVRNVGDLQPAEVQPWAQTLLRQRSENFGKDNPRYKCLPEGPGYATGGGGMKKFVQTPALIIILNEDLSYRQIFMDGRPLETDPSPSWMGYAVGRWDGDELVVDSSGYNDRTWLVDGYPHTEALRVTERYRRTDFGHLEVNVTFSDPKAYSKAWTVLIHADLAADTGMVEQVCNEDPDSGQQHWIGKLSDDQKPAVKVSPEVLSKYVGVYKGPYLRGSRTVEVTLTRDSLFLAVDGGPKQQIFPKSETSFSGTGLTYQFVREGQGSAARVLEGHVSGTYTYERQK